MSHKIALITDSTCDIPVDLRQQHDIDTVSLFIIWGAEELRDGVDIAPEQFYERLPTDPIHPKTSQPSPQDFLEAYQRAKDKGAEEIVVITISGALSGTLQSATQAARMIDIPVHTVDSKSASMGLGWQVLAAAEARAAGGDVQAMTAAANHVRSSINFLVTLDTLEYLHKGGRIGGARRFIGTVLNIKPQIYIDHNSGLIEAGERARTRGKALQATYDGFFRKFSQPQNLRIAVLHNDALPEAQEIAARIQREYSPKECLITIVSPVLGVHTGPRAIAICGYTP